MERFRFPDVQWCHLNVQPTQVGYNHGYNPYPGTLRKIPTMVIVYLGEFAILSNLALPPLSLWVAFWKEGLRERIGKLPTMVPCFQRPKLLLVSSPGVSFEKSTTNMCGAFFMWSLEVEILLHPILVCQCCSALDDQNHHLFLFWLFFRLKITRGCMPERFLKVNRP